MPYIENHALYYRVTCPYCVKVLRFMESNNITMEMRDTTQSANRDELVRIGGKAQVPCLFINGKAMYESSDIIAYLKQEFVD